MVTRPETGGWAPPVPGPPGAGTSSPPLSGSLGQGRGLALAGRTPGPCTPRRGSGGSRGRSPWRTAVSLRRRRRRASVDAGRSARPSVSERGLAGALTMLSRAALSTSRTLVPALGCLGSRQKHSLPDLPYDYGALEPHINAQIMQLHHSKHHAAYVNNLNTIEEKYLEALEKGDITAQIALQPGLKFNGGGHINHSIFWTNLSPKGGGEPKGELLEAIKRDFGSFDKFKEKLTTVSVGVQGSGWGWLGFNKEQGRLQIAACFNQDPLQGTTGFIGSIFSTVPRKTLSTVEREQFVLLECLGAS
uniref:Superoxide dismutase [Mn], mitochondrial n=1 Tax=Canis lupus familiaris TaxID=9615 RepID=A0A8I3MMB3_CANLF